MFQHARKNINKWLNNDIKFAFYCETFQYDTMTCFMST